MRTADTWNNSSKPQPFMMPPTRLAIHSAVYLLSRLLAMIELHALLKATHHANVMHKDTREPLYSTLCMTIH